MQTLEEEDEDWDEDQRSETSNSGGMILDSVLENRSILPLANVFIFIRVVTAVVLSVAELISSNASELISVVFVVAAGMQQFGASFFFDGDSLCSFDAEFPAAGIGAAVLIRGAVGRLQTIDAAKHAFVQNILEHHCSMTFPQNAFFSNWNWRH